MEPETSGHERGCNHAIETMGYIFIFLIVALVVLGICIAISGIELVEGNAIQIMHFYEKI